MPKQGSRAEVNTFVKGLVTEASPLNFPANASLDEANFELLRDGTRKRRLGMDKEAGGALFGGYGLTNTLPRPAISHFIWKSAGGNSTKDFLVLQSGSSIKIFDLSVTPTASNPVSEMVIALTSADVVMSFTSVNGRLVIASGSPNVSVITYNGSTFTLASSNIKVRDVWGVQDVDYVENNQDARPATITTAGLYNYYNQSWGLPRRTKAGTLTSPITYYKTSLSNYPSNQEVVWTGLAYVPQTGTTDPFESMYTNLYADRVGAGLAATRGYFIIDLINRGDSRTSAFAANNTKFPELGTVTTDTPGQALPIDKSSSGPTVVTEFAGRVFYAGFGGTYQNGDKRSPTLNDYVCFSQLVKNDADLAKCYQEGDPTSRDSSEVVDTDGGFMRISGARKIVAMKTLGSNLIVLADNGVWAISGGSDYGFSASNFKVDKVSDFGCAASSSIITDKSNLLFWGLDAIYAVSGNQSGTLVADDITRDTIQTRYNNIPLNAKRTVRGVYDQFEKKLRWVYNTGLPFTDTSNTQELVFDTSLKCFYINNIGTTSGSGHTVVTPVFYVNRNNPLFYIYLAKDSAFSNVVVYSFCEYNDVGFRDWRSYDGIGSDAKAYLLTGAMLAGDSAIAKQTPYIITHMKPTETGADDNGVAFNQSSCLLRSQWDWSNNINSNKWGSTQEVYGYRHPNFTNTNDGFDVITTKRKLRGKGKAISLHFETTPDKDCQLLGWSLTINGNANT